MYERNRALGLPTVAKYLSDEAELHKCSAKYSGKYLAKVGKHGENIAARFLLRKGYRIIGKNVKTFVGEIDIVAKKKSSLVFIEIKTRRSLAFGPGYLSITHKKKRKLIQCALCYLKMKNIQNRPWRIDVISIEIDRLSGYVNKIEHFEDAIEE